MKKRWLAIGIVAAVISLCVAGVAVFADPGTDTDPLISLSYLTDVFMPKVQQYVDSRIAEVNTESNGGTASAAVFRVVEAKAGDEIICSAGAELILRMGQAKIIATEKGGLADTTAGYDLANGSQMPSNHLLIVPVADGRGIKADTDIIVMIKGSYTVNE